MPLPPRIFYRNRVWGEGSTLVPSSEQPGLMREALLRQGVSDVLRFKHGWDVKAGVNDGIGYFRSGNGFVVVADIAPGNYATAALYAAAVVAALEADPTPVWTCSQDASSGLWTIGSNLAFELRFNAQPGRSAARDLGFEPGLVTASATSHTGTRATYRSRKWVTLDTTQDQGFWTIAEGINDALDFRRADPGGSPFTDYAAFVAPGVYESGAELAAAVRDALRAADPGGDWQAMYNASGFVITKLAEPYEAFLLTGTGANLAEAAWTELGFDVGSNSAAADSFTSDWAVTGSPLLEIATAALLGHTVSDVGTVRVDADTSTLVGVGLDESVPFTATLEPDPDRRSDLRLAEFAARGERYWRLVIDDTAGGAPTSSKSVVQLGIWFLGPTLTLTSVAPGVNDERQELTVLIYAAEGAHSRVERNTRRVLHLQIQNMQDADKLALEAFAADVKIGGAFFFTLEPEDPFSARYVFLDEGFTFEQDPEARPRLWTANARLLEVVG